MPGSAVDKYETILASLGAVPDEQLRIKLTLTALESAAGIRKPALLEEYTARQQKLESECQVFASIIAGQRKSDVDDKQAQIAGIDGQLQQLSMQRQAITSSIAEAQSKLERSQAGFNSAVNTVRGETESALSKLKGLV